MVKMSLAKFQQQFSSHLLSEELSDDSAEFISLLDNQFGQENAFEEGQLRLGIYRNNVIHSLSTALGDLYPVVKRLLGEDYFNYLAVSFVRQQPPSNPALVFYGKEFIELLAQQEQLQQLEFVIDVARFEYAQHRAFHSADADVLDLALLASIAPERLGDVIFAHHPSLTLIESQWPVDAIWRENLTEDPQLLDLNELGADNLLVYRLGLDVQVVKLDCHCFKFLSQLVAGHTIGQAWQYTFESAQQTEQELDENELSPMLGYLLNLSLFTHCELAQP